MKCHILFSGKNKKNISKYRLLKILPRVLSVKHGLNRTNKLDFTNRGNTWSMRFPIVCWEGLLLV